MNKAFAFGLSLGIAIDEASNRLDLPIIASAVLLVIAVRCLVEASRAKAGLPPATARAIKRQRADISEVR